MQENKPFKLEEVKDELKRRNLEYTILGFSAKESWNKDLMPDDFYSLADDRFVFEDVLLIIPSPLPLDSAIYFTKDNNGEWSVVGKNQGALELFNGWYDERIKEAKESNSESFHFFPVIYSFNMYDQAFFDIINKNLANRMLQDGINTKAYGKIDLQDLKDSLELKLNKAFGVEDNFSLKPESIFNHHTHIHNMFHNGYEEDSNFMRIYGSKEYPDYSQVGENALEKFFGYYDKCEDVDRANSLKHFIRNLGSPMPMGWEEIDRLEEEYGAVEVIGNSKFNIQEGYDIPLVCNYIEVGDEGYLCFSTGQSDESCLINYGQVDESELHTLSSELDSFLIAKEKLYETEEQAESRSKRKNHR